MVHSLSLLVLALVFLLATILPINMGILAFVATFLVGTVSGVTVDDMVAGFPGDVFILVVGITLLFGAAKVNGTIDLVVAGSLRLVRGRRWAIVWLMFVLAAVLMALGSVLAVGMLAPIAMPIAARYRINPLLMGMMLSHGALSAAFAPITVYGVFASSLVGEAALDVSPFVLFAVPFGLNVVIAAVLFAVLGRDLLRGSEVVTAGGPGAAGADTFTHRPANALPQVEVTPLRVLTLLGMCGLLVAGSLGVDVGLVAFAIATALLLVAPTLHEKSTDHVAWPAVLLVCGMLSYMEVLERNGTLDLLGEAAAALCLAVGVVSAFGSSIGTLGIALPLALPLLELGGLGAAGFIVALCFCSTVVDVSPFSTNGIIVLAQAQVEDRRAFQRRMLAYSGLVVVGAPLLAWAAVILPTSL
jgi:di/tricarboxylate transporter